MLSMEAPSFSLGLDFDLDSDPTPTPPNSNPTVHLIHHDDHFNGPDPSPPPPLKRLRGGSRPEPVTPCNKVDNDDEDDIEDFSSQDEPCRANKPSSPHHYSGCSTSKLSLHGHRVLTTQYNNKGKMTQKEQATDIPVSKSLKANSNTFTFPKLTVSPLRKFQLIDSDSDFDDPCASEYAKTEANKVNSSSKRKLPNSAKYPTMSKEKRENTSESMPREHDLWNDFNVEKRFTIPTPALDEVCEEYFRSVKSNRTDSPSTHTRNSSRKIEGCAQTHLIVDAEGVHCKLDDPIPPSRYYFYNVDLRIRNLVRNRLPYFFPLGATKGKTSHSAPSVIDYMSQFNHGEGSKPQAAQKTNTGIGLKSARKNSRKTNLEELPQDSESWVNPRSSVGIPTDAGKRRVHAVGGQSAGHWFTSPEGQKVYVSKTGQELTGRTAYIHFKKESGKAFKRPGGTKTIVEKKKSVDKNKAVPKKR